MEQLHQLFSLIRRARPDERAQGDPAISSVDVPALEALPADLGERIEAVRAKTGFVPNGHRVRDILAVVQALQACRVDRPDVVEVEGESVPLSPNQGHGLSLILHELGTDAAKYGALSRPEGRVHVS